MTDPSGGTAVLASNGADELLLGAARRAADPSADQSPFWFRHIDEAPREGTIESRVEKINVGRRIYHAYDIDDDSLRVHLPADDFVETGPGTMRASVAGLDVDADRSVAGGRIPWVAADDHRGRLLLETRLSWLYEYLQSEGTASAFFMPGEKGIFAVQGLGYGSNWAILGGGLRWQLVDGWSAYAGYDAQVNRQQLFHIGSCGLSYTW